MDCFVSAAVKKVSIIYIVLGKLTCMLKLKSFQLSRLIKPTNQEKTIVENIFQPYTRCNVKIFFKKTVTS